MSGFWAGFFLGMAMALGVARGTVAHRIERASFCEERFQSLSSVDRFVTALNLALDSQGSDLQRQWLDWLQETAQIESFPEMIELKPSHGVANAIVHRTLNELYRSARLSPASLRSALVQLIQERGNQSSARREIEKTSSLELRPMTFRKITLGGKEVELMTTHVTREHWRALLGEENPGGDEPNDSDFPVNRVSKEDVGRFVSRLNREKSRQRLKKIGLLDSENSDDVYRLLLDREIKDLLDLIRQHYPDLMGGSSPNFDIEGLKQFGWVADGDRDDQLQPVGQLKPVELLGQGFYDLWGLVREHTPKTKRDFNPITGESNPDWPSWLAWGLSIDLPPETYLNWGRPFFDALRLGAEFNRTPPLMISFRLVREPRRQWKARSKDE